MRNALSNANICISGQKYTIMNPIADTSPIESSTTSLILRQRLFVIGLLFLALVISFIVIFFLDPRAVHFSYLPDSVARSFSRGVLPA